ncbi:hypothetical protein GCM10009584_29670 [Ornithinimicrobium humiphilum]|uniref:Protein-disulfide isomerase n=1 Tax=Ornithinimicrobium humiphilum TaxID=125288 RepID=A0A543K6J0_9MICO|nr:thioredoxin domain-containing protein [Ornithinimicrobium humiphilum]TQM90698.1 protein-disulfide isomerase [Ornithinimicrobium humiphilum]
MIEQPAPTPPPPADDSRVASIAWAVAVIVVALVVALIAWLALGQDRSGQQAAPAAPSVPVQEQQVEPQQPAQPEAQEPSPEVAALLLELQRRDPADTMAVGRVDAPVVMIEYLDYRCPYCARFALEVRPGLQELVDEGVLRIEYRDLVLFDEPSRQAAVATRAAAAQDRLAPYQEAVFGLSREGHGEVDRQVLLDLAEQVGVPDLAAFEAALDDPELAAAVDADTAEARSLGLSSTPTFIVNTRVVQGVQPADYFERLVAQERDRGLVSG